MQQGVREILKSTKQKFSKFQYKKSLQSFAKLILKAFVLKLLEKTRTGNKGTIRKTKHEHHFYL